MTETSNPFDPRVLAEASRAGDGEAAHGLAVLTGMGLGVPHDWDAAMALLGRAAELGFAPAREQLSLLAGATVESGWVAAAAAVDVAAWLSPSPPRPLGDGPAIFTFEGFLPTALCDVLTARAAARTEPALVYDPDTGGGRREGVRTNAATLFDLDHMDVLLVLIRERIARAAGLPVAGLEWTQVLHYGTGQTFDWHSDWLDPARPGYQADLAARGQRIATMLVFLNDDFEGGETAFEAGGLHHRGRKGDALLWANTLPSGEIDRRTRHAGLPPTRGEKWVLSQWLRGRAPRT